MKKIIIFLMLISSTAWIGTAVANADTQRIFTPEELEAVKNLPPEKLNSLMQELKEQIWREDVLKELKEINRKLSVKQTSTVKR